MQEARNQYHAKKYAQAISLYSQALEMRPDPVNSAMLYNARGTAKMDAEDHSAAIADFDRALGLRPTETWTLNMAAWLRATSRDPAARDGKVAVQQATRACELTNWKDPDIVDTLAAAHAEAGDFERAVERQQQAIKIAPWPDRMRMHERLRLFQQRAPYRQKERRR
ncbi:MAG TPA: tetratricopeptide repeat protein [Chthoniobacterales bacterium]|nr:tetratricopeptide repeat protein [Chthoniobacterales bacterium]